MKKLIMALFFILLIHQIMYCQSMKKIILNDKDSTSGYYLAFEPGSDSIEEVLVLLAGFSERAESIFPQSKLPNVTYANKILTIAFAEGNKITADSIVQSKISAVLEDVIKKYKVKPDGFVLGGYSAGGIVAMRYVELCNEYPDRFPIKPRGIFTVDSPVDLFTVMDDLENNLKNNYSVPAHNEAEIRIEIC